MKCKIRKRCLFCLLALISMLCLSGCSDNSGQSTPSVDTIKVEVSFDFPGKDHDKTGIMFRADEDCSVLQIIQLYGSVNSIPILVDTTNSTLEGIDGVINHVTQKNSIWQYKINGAFGGTAIDKTIVNDGDILEFVYTKEPQ